MKKLALALLALLFVGHVKASDTLYVKLVQDSQQVHKDTLNYWFSSSVTPVFFEDLKDSIDIYHPKVLNLWIYMYGGDPLVAIDFYFWLKSQGIKINTYAGGIVASAGTIMFLWGDERYVSEGALLFVHQVSTWVFLEKYNPNSSERMTVGLKTIQKTIERFMARRAGIPIEKMHLWMLEEKWFTYQEAIESGFATGVITMDGAMESAKNRDNSELESNDLP